jgi:hypothetical protein
MAAEIEASLGQLDHALGRINGVVAEDGLGELKEMALIVKSRVAMKALDQESAEAAIEDLEVVNSVHPRLRLLKQKYERVFSVAREQGDVEDDSDESEPAIDDAEAAKLVAKGLRCDDEGDFFSTFEIANLLSANGRHLDVVNLLSNCTSLTRINPALSLLADS